MNPYQRHIPHPDVFELSHTPRVSVPYEPRSCDLVEFEADERVQHVVLASPIAGIQAPNGGHRDGHGVAAQSDSAGRSGGGRPTKGGR
jgi:hypothetical protein